MYAIAGVNGQTGAAVAESLLAAKAPLRVLVRTAESGKRWAARGAEVVVTDLDDAASLTQALRGAQGAFLLNPPSYASADPFSVAEQRGATFAQAIAASGVPRVVVLSSVGAHHAQGTGIIGTTHRVEQALAGASASIAFLRASFFMENWAHVLHPVRSDGVLPSFLQPLDRAIEMVSVADIGAAAARLLTGPAWQGRRVVELAGSVAASPRQVADGFAALLQRPVTPIAVPREQWSGILSGNGFSPAVVQAFVDMYDGINDGHVVARSEPVRGELTLQAALQRLLVGGGEVTGAK